MSGITGIISKHPVIDSERLKLEQSLGRMMSKLVYYPEQKNNTFCNSKIFIGNSVPISSKLNDHYVKNDDLPYHIMVDGIIFINENEKKILGTRYDINDLNNNYYYLPFLFDHYKSDFVHHLTGWFNIFIHTDQTDEDLFFNDRLGFLPLYYYDDKDHFLFSSKIESILASGLMSKIQFDEVTIAEHLFFNYPLSDNTYIKRLFTLPDASFLTLDRTGFSIARYWDVNEFFNIPQVSKKHSIETINRGMEYALGKFINKSKGKVNFSLTGGWDSRLVLSYFLPEKKGSLNVYSFGAPQSEDILIPEQISKNEGLKYTPYCLDQSYLDNDFLKNAVDTILLSNGTRNYKRTHYVYTMKKIPKVSDMLITGIFGDEVFKAGKPKGGTVISINSIEFIESGFDVRSIIKKFKESGIEDLFIISVAEFENEFEKRLEQIRKRFLKYKTSGQHYFAFRFTLNLRKYFGNEANSYNDFAYCCSPFIDYDFLKELSRTKYMGSRFDFKSPSLMVKSLSSWLYFEITRLNYARLTIYPSSRGFSMKDAVTISGLLRVLYSKFVNKKSGHTDDSFNTRGTASQFYDFLSRNNHLNSIKIFKRNIREENIYSLENYHSIIFWLSVMQSKYQK